MDNEVIDCWHAHIPEHSDWPAFWLSPEEQQRLAQLHQLKRQREFAWGRILLRYLLAQRLGCQPWQVELLTTAAGKPHCTMPGAPHFNLSHSQSQLVVALAQVPIGIDLEWEKPGRAFLEIAQCYFSEEEKQSSEGLSPAEQQQLFYRIWVQKEALGKALGTGLSGVLSSPQAQGRTHQVVSLACHPLPGYWFGAAAATSKPVSVQWHPIHLPAIPQGHR